MENVTSHFECKKIMHGTPQKKILKSSQFQTSLLVQKLDFLTHFGIKNSQKIEIGQKRQKQLSNCNVRAKVKIFQKLIFRRKIRHLEQCEECSMHFMKFGRFSHSAIISYSPPSKSLDPCLRRLHFQSDRVTENTSRYVIKNVSAIQPKIFQFPVSCGQTQL